MPDSAETLTSETIEITCDDGVRLGTRFWPGTEGGRNGAVLINPATGVLARYYHRYAAFLAGHGFAVLSYDYRGIGGSRPARLRGCGYRWRDWGELDCDAALRWLRARCPKGPLLVVGHSIGGVLPGLAESGASITRILTMGAQYAYWRDYAPEKRARLVLKWHLAMPALTALCGFFPGRRLGWLEDLPAGVAHEWSFRRARIEDSHPAPVRARVVERLAAVTAPILAVALSDDELGTVPALRRTLAYYRGAEITEVLLRPADLGHERIGHFSLFHARHTDGFWRQTLDWLRDGRNPWPRHPFPPA